MTIPLRRQTVIIQEGCVTLAWRQGSKTMLDGTPIDQQRAHHLWLDMIGHLPSWVVISSPDHARFTLSMSGEFKDHLLLLDNVCPGRKGQLVSISIGDARTNVIFIIQAIRHFLSLDEWS